MSRRVARDSATYKCLHDVISFASRTTTVSNSRPFKRSVDPTTTPHCSGDFADSICKKHSVSFDTKDFRHEAQAFDYGTDEWDEFHTHARNSIESLNHQVKSGGTEDIETASRRRVRGFSAAQIIVTLLLTNFNIRNIAAFMSDKI